MTDEKQVPKAAFLARKGKERRRWKRVSAKIRVILKDSDTFVPLITRNIDPGGMFLQTDEPKARLELVNLRIDMGKGQSPLVVLGVVKHALNKARARELNRIPGMGIQFYGMSAGDQIRWNTVVQRMEALEGEPLEDEASRGASRPRTLPVESRLDEEPAPIEGEDLVDTEILLDLETPLAEDEQMPEEGLADLLEGSQEPLVYNLPVERQRERAKPSSAWARGIEPEGLIDLLEDVEQPSIPVSPTRAERAPESLTDLLEDVEQPSTRVSPTRAERETEDLADLLEDVEQPPNANGLASVARGDDELLLMDEEGEWPPRTKGSGRLGGIAEEISQVILEEEQPLGSMSGLAELLEGDEEQAPSWSGTAIPAVGHSGEYEIRLVDIEGLRSFIDHNVMQGTVFLETEDLVENGRTIDIHLIHPETEEAFPLVGTVVSLNPGVGDTPRGMGVRFQGLTERHWEGLEKFVVYGFNVL